MGFGSDLSALHNRIADLRWVEEPGEKIEPAGWSGSSSGKLRPWLHLTGAKQQIDTAAPFDQQVLKLEGGIDASFAAGNGGRKLFGAFAGTGRTEQDFDSSTTAAEADMALAGLYGGYRKGAFYGNALVKYEHYWADIRSSATNDEDAPFDVDLLGVSLESGYRFDLEHMYLQPRLRVNYAHAWASDFEDSSGITIDLKNADMLTGELGARLGLLLDGPEFYLDGGVRHEFLGKTQAEVSGLTYSDALPGTVAFAAGGMTVRLMQNKLSLQFEAGYAKGDEAEEITASGALRVMY